ncbi:hydroxyacylglutathione hydrolase [Ramlibacter tataouinensis]|uniref:Hydroxyacylglutathione hydrolase n=1 Tax=Ramlibacter tataouinensis (strain ATCC BAA-407 / DSM 14655 / LMG 21543 / TTB310) TaxID=365046 RepID=F5Y0L5_RAMTT|nr:hydroxyacylglutathione hydrolase [Ramlibacter tataouinensis]AEG93421.1 Candidate hydroxyacylglutathione hydrolase (Glyoxalase II) [Ramlibacter tataouinensis TTB310]
MKLLPLPAFQDNYLWLLHDGHRALVVDPGDAQPVLAALRQAGLQLEAILVTHHHPDHIGGLEEVRRATGATVYGPARETIPEPLTRVAQGDVVRALGLSFQVLDVPGHTAGHIAYFHDPHAPSSLPPGGAQPPRGGPAAAGPDVDGTPLLFCGDTLFSGGCGRLFEGTPAQMLASLDALAALPGDTRVCCAHEYTLANLKFARAVEPGNAELVDYTQHCEALRSQGQPTLPTTVAQEKRINPFLRTRESGVRHAAEAFNGTRPGDDVGVFAAIRQWKNEYR